MVASVHEVKMKSTGFPGAPGWTTFYFDGDDATAHANQFRQVKAFLDGISGYEPPVWKGQVQASGRTLLAATGELIGLTTAPADGTTDLTPGTSTDTSFGPGPAGLCVAWSTVGVNRSHKVRGRTFVVPIASVNFDADGTITGDVMTGIDSGFFDLVTSLESIGIWSRPRAGAGGAWFPITAAHVVDQAAVLRTRR